MTTKKGRPVTSEADPAQQTATVTRIPVRHCPVRACPHGRACPVHQATYPRGYAELARLIAERPYVGAIPAGVAA
jgi:hypothetical protein